MRSAQELQEDFTPRTRPAQLLRRKLTESIRCGHAAVHEEVAAGDKRAVAAHQESADGAHLIRRAGAAGGGID